MSTNAIRDLLHLGWHFALGVAVIVSASVIVSERPANAQGFGTKQRTATVILPPPPRDLRRSLEYAERAMQQRQYSEAIEALNEILDRPDAEDYFLPGERTGEPNTSLKQRALASLGSMPKAGREIYELESGSEARRLLQQAAEKDDFDGILEVSRRFFHTEVGYKATMLLARIELDQGRPLAAALHLERLIAARGARRLFGVELPIQLAVCWKMAGFDDSAAKILRDEYDGAKIGGSRIMLAGESVVLPADEAGLTAWFNDVIGQGLVFDLGHKSDWSVFRGGPDRNASVSGGMPMRKLSWALESALLPGERALVLQTHESLIANEIPAIPIMQPLAVENQLLMRTARVMFGVDIESGLRVWPYPEEALDIEEPVTPAKPSPRRSYLTVNSQDETTRLKKRFWQDAAYAQMSSDGKRLFLLRDLEERSVNLDPRRMALQMQMRGFDTGFNRLVALELDSQGKTLWMVGGEDSEDPRLQSIYFLGAPLPLDGHLYCIAEIKDELKLVVIESATGQLEWMQQLVQVEVPISFMADPIRRLAGATPSFSEGILICPTSSGAVVAVDIASRSLRWAHQYFVKNKNPLSASRMSMYTPTPVPSPGDHWADSTAIVKDGCVILTPFESDRLICLDLLTGREKWKARERETGLYVGGVEDGIVLVIERHRVVGLSLETGQPAWAPIELAGDEYPTGRGFLNNGAYFFPTSQSEILKVDISAGTITERQPTERVLGNLVCHGDFLVSQNADGIFAYPLRDRRRAAVLSQIKETPDNPDILEDYASLLVADGRRAEAMAALRKALKFQTDEERREVVSDMLVRVIIDTLRDDFAANRGLVEEAASLVQDAETRSRLSQVVADGLTASGELEAGFVANLDMVDATIAYRAAHPISNRKELRRSEGKWHKSEQIVLSNRIRAALVAADSQLRPVLDDLIRQRLDKIRQQQSPELLRGWLRVAALLSVDEEVNSNGNFDFDGAIRGLRFGLARRLLDVQQPLEAVMLLDQIIGDQTQPRANDETTVTARVLRAQALASYGRTQMASVAFESLAAEYGDRPIFNSRSAPELLATFKRDLGDRPSEQESEPRFGGISTYEWPDGKIIASPPTFKAPPVVEQWYPVYLLSKTEEWPEGSRIVLDNRHSQLHILDAYNRVSKTIDINSKNQAAYRATQARAFGHLLVVSFGTNVICIDLLTKSSEDQVLWNFNLGDDEGMFALEPFGRPKRIRSTTRNVVFSQMRQRFVGPDTKPVGMIGPVTHDGVCLIRQGDLHCLDLYTGELKWVRRNVGNNNLFGDDEHVMVLQKAKDVSVFRIKDGREVVKNPDDESDSFRVPLGTYHWDTFGRCILYYDGSYTRGTGLELRLYDTILQEDRWAQKVAAKTKGRIVDGEELALFQPDGRFMVLDIETGKMLVDTQLKKEPTAMLPFFYVARANDHYLVMTNRDDSRRTSKQRSLRISIPQSGWLPSTPKITGHLYALDRETGDSLWEKPVSVEQYGMLLPQGAKVPVVCFFRQVRQTKSSDGVKRENSTTTAVAVVDRRTGREVFVRDSMPFAVSGFCSLTASPEENKIRLFLPGETEFEMTVTDQEDDAAIAALDPVPYTRTPPLSERQKADQLKPANEPAK